MGSGDLVCTVGCSWHEDVFFPRGDQPLATEATASVAAMVIAISNRDVIEHLGDNLSAGEKIVQSLKIFSRLVPDVPSCNKQHTIHWRERKIIPGPTQYMNAYDDAETSVVRVTEVKAMELLSVSRHLVR